MSEEKPGPFQLTQARIVILIMGALAILITVSMLMGGLGSYQALKDAANAAKEPTAEQRTGN